jgi:hypothetical protein
MICGASRPAIRVRQGLNISKSIGVTPTYGPGGCKDAADLSRLEETLTDKFEISLCPLTQ